MSDCIVVNFGSELEAYLIATPDGLSELFDAVELALSSIEGCARVQIPTADKRDFILHIIRRVEEEK